MDAAATHTFDILEGHEYMNLTTFYADGRPRTTPVWFAREEDTLYVMTDANAYKVKRLEQMSRATVQPCDRAGKPLDDGPIAHAEGRVLPPDDPLNEHANKLLTQKYGLMKRFFDLMGKLRGGERVFLEINEATP